MFIGKDCFADIELLAMLERGGTKGNCDITGAVSTFGYNTEGLGQIDLPYNLYEIVEIYTPASDLPNNYPEDKLDYIENILANNWNIFNNNISKQDIKRIVMEVCKELLPPTSKEFKEKVGIEQLNSPEYLKKHCLTKNVEWDNFVDSIKYTNRFHSDQLSLELLFKLFNSEGMQREIHKNDPSLKLLRGRICDERGIKPEKMGAPPKTKVTAGRVNSKGIRCLYLTTDIKTSLHEIRAKDFDYVSIGEFVPKKNLKLIDLSRLESISPFADDSGLGYEWFAINMPILKKISYEIAKPLRRQDSEIDYLPTQYIADYVKSMGFDGICYKSTLNQGGINYAMFDPTAFSCKTSTLYQIDPVQFSWTEIAPIEDVGEEEEII